MYDPPSSCGKKGLHGNADAGAVLYQLRYQANWEMVISWVDDESVDDGYRSTYVMLMILGGSYTF